MAQTKRRTQEERRQETQKRLCVATLNVLAQLGYDKTSTSLISEEAGVSRGAMTHHYPTKHELILAAYEYLLNQWRIERKQFFNSYAGKSVPFREYLDFLWGRVFNTKYYVVTLELAISSRGDPKLFADLQAATKRWIDIRNNYWADYFEAVDAELNVQYFAYMTTSFLRGLTVQSILSNDSISNRQLLDSWIKMAEGYVRPKKQPGA